MARIHPHAEASYRVIAFGDGSFGVEVSIPESFPTTVKAFGTAADAEVWIAGHRDRVQSESTSGRWFSKFPGTRRR